MTKKEKRILVWRILIGTLIVCNMAVIFLFSAQSRSQSAALSQKITSAIVRIISSDSANKTVNESNSQNMTTTPSNKNENNGEELTEEQKALVNKSHTPVRKLAHMLEFGSLATLAFLFLITWPGKLLWRYAASLGFTLIYAGTDELHQLFSDGRGARLSDVFIDFSGAFIACTLALIIVMLVRRIKKTNTDDSSATEQKPAFIDCVSQMFSRFQSFISSQISKLQKIHQKEEKEK